MLLEMGLYRGIEEITRNADELKEQILNTLEIKYNFVINFEMPYEISSKSAQHNELNY
jgi:hypothetical protein